MSEAVRVITNGVASASMIALAIWLIAIGPRRRANRALAFWLTMRASITLLNQAQDIATDARAIAIFDELGAIVTIAATLSIFYFVLIAQGPKRWMFPVFATAIGAATILQMSGSCLITCAPTSYYGPLGFLASGVVAATATAGLLLAVRTRKWPANGPVAAGLALLALAQAAILPGLIWQLGRLPDVASGPLGFTAVWFPIVAGAIAITALTILTQRADARQARILWGIALAAGATGFSLGGSVGSAWTTWWFALLGVWRFVLPIGIVYGVVRHGAIHMDRAIAIPSGVLAGALTVVFFLVGESIEQMVDVPSLWLGVGAAAGIGLLMRPIQIATHRFMDRLLADPPADLSPS